VDPPGAPLTVAVASSNEQLVPASGLALFGVGNLRTLLIAPAGGQEGTATITLRVEDGELNATASFTTWVLDNPFPWHNLARPLDVDGNGEMAPLDALLVINYLNAGLPTKIAPTAGAGGGPGFLDTSANNEIAPLDALLIINALNEGPNQLLECGASHQDRAYRGSRWRSRLSGHQCKQ
jgi:hypothetical protein